MTLNRPTDVIKNKYGHLWNEKPAAALAQLTITPILQTLVFG